MSVDTKEAGPREPCCSKLKIFIASMCYLYFAKSFGDAYMKSSIIQIERRFGIPSSLIGVINGSFEMGNLLVIAFVSYFGGKLHRPRLIAAGCLVMAAGAFCSALPHFFMERYTYESSVTHSAHANATDTGPCMTSIEPEELPSAGHHKAGCEKEAGSSMWVYVFVGNMLRGIGETPVVSLGVSYLDDFSREENTAFYIACIQTIGMFGPIAGYMMGSFCAKIYVDIDTVDLDTVTIDHRDHRWVGAWWLGFLLTTILMLVAGLPFWFLPKSLPKQGQPSAAVEEPEQEPEQEDFLPEDQPATHQDTDKTVTFAVLAKDFFPSLKRLFSNGVYRLVLLVSLVALNSFIGLLTYEPKFMEQVYGQPASKTIMLIGTMTLPAMAAGFITGGIVLKRFKLGMLGASRICVGATFLASCLYLLHFFLYCDNAKVAGLTVTYQGEPQVSVQPESMVSGCNAQCSCSVTEWDPVCSSSSGLTYASPCLAGCHGVTGQGKDTMYGNCTCVREMLTGPGVNMSAVLGQCPRAANCDHMFKFYMAVAVLASFINACGATPAYIILLRCIQPDLKSLALGMQTLVVRTLGGIPPPIYFGALIDLTCLKWGTKACGGHGACRFYDTNTFRFTFLGLIYGIFTATWALWALLHCKIVKRQKKLARGSLATEKEVEAIEMNKVAANVINDKEDMERHSTI